ncbi:MAG: hypothetical protein ABIU86_12785 [Gemmatimonadaceae bacterium]
MFESHEGDEWKRTAADEQRDIELSAITGLYWQARYSLTYREVFGRPGPALPEDAPRWLRDNLDETGLATVRAQFIDTHNRYKPAEGWEYPDGQDCGAWLRLPQDPARLIDWLDNHARDPVREMKTLTPRGM